jgi:hypothetical protein
MKLFVSWSQDISRQIAQDFREWLPLLIQTIEPFMSEEDTDKGAHWSFTIRRELEQSAIQRNARAGRSRSCKAFASPKFWTAYPRLPLCSRDLVDRHLVRDAAQRHASERWL